MFEVRTLVNVKVFGIGYIDSNVSAMTASHSLTPRCGAEEVQTNVFSATALDGCGQFRATAASEQEGRAPYSWDNRMDLSGATAKIKLRFAGCIT